MNKFLELFLIVVFVIAFFLGYKMLTADSKREANFAAEETAPASGGLTGIPSGPDALNQDSASVDVKKMSQEVAMLKKELDVKDENIDSLTGQLRSFKEQYSALVQERDDLHKDIQAIKEAHSVKENLAGYGQQRTEELAAQLAEVQEEKAKLENRLDDFDKSKGTLEQEIKDLKQKKEELGTLNRDLQERITQLLGELEENKKKLAELEADLEQPALTSDREASSLRRKLTIQQEKFDEITTLYNRLKQQLRDVARILSRKERELSDKNREIDGLKNEVSHLRLELSNLEIKVADLEDSLRKSKASQEANYQRLQEASELNTILQGRMSEAGRLLGKQIQFQPIYEAGQDMTEINPQAGQTKEQPESYSVQDEGSVERADDLKKQIEVIFHPSQGQE